MTQHRWNYPNIVSDFFIYVPANDYLPISSHMYFHERHMLQVVAAIVFAVCSRKRKKEKAPNERFAIEEEPTIIGR